MPGAGRNAGRRAVFAAVVAATAPCACASLDGTALVLTRLTQRESIARVSLSASVIDAADTIVHGVPAGADWRDTGEIQGPCFSPDGKRIAFCRSDRRGPLGGERTVIYTVGNDGGLLDTVCLTEDPQCAALCLSWAGTGSLYWSEGSDRVYRADLATKQRQTVARLADFAGPKPNPLRIDNLQMSLDATRGGFMVNGVGYCISLDFVNMVTRDYGPGCQGTVSPDGQLVTHESGLPEYYYHQVGFIHDFTSQAILDTFYAPGSVPDDTSSAPPRFGSFHFSHSSSKHIVFSGEDGLAGNGYVRDLPGKESVLLGRCTPYDYWAGALPSPSGPFIALSRASMVFSAQTDSPPPPETVAVVNLGGTAIGAPTDLVIGRIPGATPCAGLAWRNNSTKQTAFVVERRTEPGTYAVVHMVRPDSTTCLDTLPGAGLYTYRVRAVADADSSGCSNETALRIVDPSYIVVRSPSTGTSWNAGTAQYIQWIASGVSSVVVKYSVDHGDTWRMITGSGAVSIDSPAWGSLGWLVPSLSSDSALVSVEAYDQPALFGMSGYFTIRSRTGAAARAPATPVVTALRSRPAFAFSGVARFDCDLAPGDRATLRIYRLDGSEAAAITFDGRPGRHEVEWRGATASGGRAASGFYLVKLERRSP